MGRNGPSMVIHVCDEAKKRKNLNKIIIIIIASIDSTVLYAFDYNS